ncbi:MAG: sulfotransferase [Chthoniobacterales bacterium]|nr:sulfotransferase [Chthoniobacterales bacterium]
MRSARPPLPARWGSRTALGWKAPRSIYFLPLFHQLFPSVKFIHVLRDGRDMAFSDNQNQLRQHGRAILSWRERWFVGTPLRSILLWDRVNYRAATFAEARLGSNYLAVRFEDLCRSPVVTVERVLCFLGSSIDAREVASAEITPPATLSRWKAEPEEITRKLTAAAAGSLRKFGYL